MKKESLLNKNSIDIESFKKKYSISRNFLFGIFYLLGKKNTVNNKLSRIPQKFIQVFDQESYLYANLDLQKRMDKKQFDSALEHFILYGYDEVKEGKRRLGNEFPFITEDEYLEVNPDLKSAFQEGKITSPFTHLLTFGYAEFQNGTRSLTGYYPFTLTDQIISVLKEKFDDETYISANLDLLMNESENAWDHLLTSGINDIRKGKRVFNKDIPFISEHEYVTLNSDVFKLLKEGLLSSPSEHFFLHGMWEILNDTRKVKDENIYRYYESDFRDTIKREIEDLKNTPLFSIVIIIENTKYEQFVSLIESFEKQWYEHWELHIVYHGNTDLNISQYLKSLSNDKINTYLLEKDQNRAYYLNTVLPMLNGEYIVSLFDNDLLTVDTLYEVLRVINSDDAELIYCDEDRLRENGHFTDPNFRPDLSLEMIMSVYYAGSLLVMKKTLIQKVGAWDETLDSCENYDIFLKIIEISDKIIHIDKVLYHHRKIQNCNDAKCNKETGQIVLENALKRRKIVADVLPGLTYNSYRIKYPIVNDPLVSIVIPFKDKPELLEMCLGSILEKSTYNNFEIIGISNNSEEEETFMQMKVLEDKDKRVHFYEYNEPFNYSAVNNYAVNNFVKGEHVILLNNDIEIISPEWIESMLEFSQKPDIGAVGAKLYYPDDTVQHAGVVIGIGDSAGHIHRHFQKKSSGYHDRLSIIQNYSAVTAACLMVKTALYHEMKGLNEDDLKVAFNDVDFCLRIMEKGYRNVYTPFTEAYHYESISRGYEDSSEKIQRFHNERGYLQERHAVLYEKGDPYYNKNLTLQSEDFSPGKYVSSKKREYLGKTFIQNIVMSETFNIMEHDFVCIFAHYDKDNIIDPYVIYYLEKLSVKYDIVFVSTATGLTEKELSKISPYCMQGIVKENVGYDFGAWKTGLDFLGTGVEDYAWLTLCNDSVYGPFQPIDVITTHMEDNSCDIFSLSENFERKRHFQSYFVSYNKKVFMHNIFRNFWDNFKIYEDKTTLINTCEIDFAHSLINVPEFRVKTFAKRYNGTYVNIVQFFWHRAIMDGFPFMKIELFKDNPLKVDISDWKRVIRLKTNYPIKLISNHLKRMK